MTVRVKVGVKVAVTVVAAVRDTAQAPEPVQPPPLQPGKTGPAKGVVVTVPALLTVRVKVGVTVTVKLAVAVLPAASCAVTVSTFVPGWRTIPLAVQLVVPVAVPVPPRLLTHVTWVTPTLSAAVPPSGKEELLVV